MREEGPVALYKGFIPKVLRLAPGGGVLLLVVELTLEMFRQGSSPLPSIVIHLTFRIPVPQLSDLPMPEHLYSIWSERMVDDTSITHPQSASFLDTARRRWMTVNTFFTCAY